MSAENECPEPKRPRRDVALMFDGQILHMPSALSARDLASLENYLESDMVQSSLQEAVLHDSAAAQYKSRRCDSAWLHLCHMPAARKLKHAIKRAQDEWEVLPRTKRGVLRCHYEDVQYTEYRGDRLAHFKQWHIDADDDGGDEEDKREITVVALLTEPGTDFEGGDFECMVPAYPDGIHHTLAWHKGDIIAFLAKRLWHRVLPTTAGIRKTLVLWAKPPFK
ncbi:hypothetical protein CTAYLR_008547 [Chrysophaeum taylorii]|uniref:Fe2OG dioxygenase domain-containing protein n=1 Tax=Chrysophaeum taylorii TaxID=2483200 RepID=A0AAD7XHY9_9STRA|nr:hypothetical protein CTAYLR_008547 [Chrysophaeum taylorii]